MQLWKSFEKSKIESIIVEFFWLDFHSLLVLYKTLYKKKGDNSWCDERHTARKSEFGHHISMFCASDKSAAEWKVKKKVKLITEGGLRVP